MAIRFECPLGHRLIVPDERAGKKGKCPVCRQRVVIPRPGDASSKPLPFSANPNVVSLRFPPAPDRFEAGESVVEEFDPDNDLPPRADDQLPPPGSFGPPLPTEPLADPGLDLSQPAPTMRLHQELPSERPFAAPPDAVPPPPPPPPPVEAPTPFSAPAEMAQPSSMSPPPPMAAPPVVAAPVTYEAAPAVQLAAPTAAIPPAGPVPRAESSGSPASQPDVYEPEPHRVQTVYMLAVGLAIVTLFSIAPALKHLNLADAPAWARIVLLVAALQLLYVAWMVSLPDWSTVWIGMVVFASVSALYAAGMGVAMFTPIDRPIVLGMADVRQTAAGWCLAVLLLMIFMTYLCGRISTQWRKAYEIAKARRAELHR